MAFLPKERALIRYYLGRSSRYYQISTDLESAMTLIGQDADASALILADIARCQEIDRKIRELDDFAGVERANRVSLNHAAGLSSLRSQGRETVGRIAGVFGVPIGRDVYSPSAAGGNGGVMKQG